LILKALNNCNLGTKLASTGVEGLQMAYRGPGSSLIFRETNLNADNYAYAMAA